MKFSDYASLDLWTHAEFVKIHPFLDGNGRTSRLIMNYQLLANGFPAVSIAKENQLEYFNTLETYAVEGDLRLFAEMIAGLVSSNWIVIWKWIGRFRVYSRRVVLDKF